MSSILKTSLVKIQSLSTTLTDLVLGQQADSSSDASGTQSNAQEHVSIPFAAAFLTQSGAGVGQITEFFAFEPETLSVFIETLTQFATKYRKSLALLGVENAVLEHLGGDSLYIMPTDDAVQLLFAAQELVKSKAIDVIVVNEILLKADASRTRNQSLKWLVGELRKLKREIFGSELQIVLVNPATSERKHILRELETICSQQFRLARNEVEKDEIKDRY